MVITLQRRVAEKAVGFGAREETSSLFDVLHKNCYRAFMTDIIFLGSVCMFFSGFFFKSFFIIRYFNLQFSKQIFNAFIFC